MTKKELFENLRCPGVNEKILLLTHNDLDGIGPAILLKAAYPSENVTVERCSNGIMSKKIEDAVFENSQTGQYDMIIACDISCTKDAAERISQFPGSADLVLLDHHVTASYLNDYPWAVVWSGMPDDSFRRGEVPIGVAEDQIFSSGTSLLYDFLEYNGMDRNFADKEKAKRFTHIVASYDTWMWQNVYQGAKVCKDVNALFFIRGASDFEAHMLAYVNSPDIPEILDDFDKRLLEIEDRRTKESVDMIARGFKSGFLEIGDRKYSAVFVTTSQHISAVFERMQQDYPEHDLYVMNNGTKIVFRSRKDDIDVGKIAALAGGGGHKGASGISAYWPNIQRFMADVMQIDPDDIQLDDLSGSPQRSKDVKQARIPVSEDAIDKTGSRVADFESTVDLRKTDVEIDGKMK